MNPIVEIYDKIKANIQNADDLEEMIKETKDKEEK